MARWQSPDGVSLRYESNGPAPTDGAALPLIFVHGWCSNLRHWAPQVRAFSRKRAILRIDRRGMGQSRRAAGIHSAGQHAADTAAIAAHTGIGRAIVIGHAGGGPSALTLARDYPELVAGLVMIDSAMYPQPVLGDSQSPFGAVLGDMITRLRGADGREQLRLMYASYFGERCDPVVSNKAIEQALTTPLKVAIAELEGMSVSTQDIAAALEQPILWLTAGPVDQAYIAQHVRNLWFGQVTGAGHFPQLEVPEQVTAMLSTFFEQM